MLLQNRRSRLIVVSSAVLVLVLVGVVVVLRTVGNEDASDDRSPSPVLLEAVDRGSLPGLIDGVDDEDGVVPGATPAERARFVLTEVEWDADRAAEVADAVGQVSQDDDGDGFVEALVTELAAADRPLSRGTASGVLGALADRPWEVIKPFAAQVEAFMPTPRTELDDVALAQVLALAGADETAAEVFRLRMYTALEPLADRSRALELDAGPGDRRPEVRDRVERVWLRPLASVLGVLSQRAGDPDLVQREANDTVLSWGYSWTPVADLPADLVLEGRPVPLPLLDGASRDAFQRWRTEAGAYQLLRIPSVEFERAVARDLSF